MNPFTEEYTAIKGGIEKMAFEGQYKESGRDFNCKLLKAAS